VFPKRRSVRIVGYDYAQPGAYFVTLCVAGRRSMFGRVVDGVVILSPLGTIAEQALIWLSERYSHIRIPEYAVMPNHLHAIVSWDAPSDPPKPLGALVNAYKATASGRMRRHLGDQGATIWQRGLYEHIIEDEAEFYEKAEYIRHNAETWEWDHENPDAVRSPK